MNDNDRKNVINAAELVSRQWRPRTWLLWQMIPMGGITLLAGETASGKTMLALDLALGLASGRGKAWDMEIDDKQTFGTGTARCAPSIMTAFPIIGTGRAAFPTIETEPAASPTIGTGHTLLRRHRATFPTKMGASHVRYFCRDADPHLLAERIDRLCRGYHPDHKTSAIEVPVNLDFDFSARVFSEPTDFTWLQNEIEKKGYQLLVFDSLAQYLPGMADGSASTVGGFLRGLRQLASQTGVTILLIHQFNKRQAARHNKWGLPTSLGEERVRGSSELLAGVDSALLLSRPEAFMLEGRGRAFLEVVKNRLGQAGARLNFSIVDGEPANADGVAHNTLCQGASEVLRSSLHLLFDHLAPQAQPKPRRLVDAALDGMMHILMEQDQRKFTRAELTKLLQERMNLPSTRSLTEAFRILGKEEQVRIERDETGKKRYAWAQPGTGAIGNLTYGLPPIMAFDLGSKWIWSKTQQLILRAEVEKMEGKDKNSELVEKLAAFVKEQEGKEKKADSS